MEYLQFNTLTTNTTVELFKPMSRMDSIITFI